MATTTSVMGVMTMGNVSRAGIEPTFLPFRVSMQHCIMWAPWCHHYTQAYQLQLLVSEVSAEKPYTNNIYQPYIKGEITGLRWQFVLI